MHGHGMEASEGPELPGIEVCTLMNYVNDA